MHALPPLWQERSPRDSLTTPAARFATFRLTDTKVCIYCSTVIIPVDEELELVWKELGALEESLQNQLQAKNRQIAALEDRLELLEELISGMATPKAMWPRRAI